MKQAANVIPQTIPEKLLYNTIRITSIAKDKSMSFGTGFFFVINLDDSRHIELILTNKHVVKDSDQLSFLLHEAKEIDDKLEPTGQFIEYNLRGFSNLWIPHPSEDIDLGALVFTPIKEDIKNKLQKIVFSIPFEKKMIRSDLELKEEASVAEEVLMAGYPIGLFDTHNNLPIIRKGIIATDPSIDFQGRSIGLADIACFPGSSGSPILLYKDGSFTKKSGETVIGRKTIFLGLLSSGPVYTSEGVIKIREIPTSNSLPISINEQMIHLGYYVKAKEILILCSHILERLRFTQVN